MQAFSDMYSKLRLPVVVCKNDERMTITYMNMQASMMFSPYRSSGANGSGEYGGIEDLLYFETSNEADAFLLMARSQGNMDNYPCELCTFDGKRMSASLYGNNVTVEAPLDYYIFFLILHENESCFVRKNYNHQLAQIISASLLSDNVDTSIQTVLALAGAFAEVGRILVVEEVSPTLVRNTYEWCGQGVPAKTESYQDRTKAELKYDLVTASGLYVCGDINELPQGASHFPDIEDVRAFATLSFYDNERLMGYVSFCDCDRTRAWEHDEISFMESITLLIAMLIKRRNAESGARNILNILQIVSQNSDDIIYANRLDDYTIVFANHALAASFGTTPQALLGQVCYKVFQKDQAGPCPFCPIPKIQLAPEAERSETYVWEHENRVLGKSYLVKDALVKWVDGEYVHLENATDISSRIEFERELRYYASTDNMTDIPNRMWGSTTLENAIENNSLKGSLCFFDIDGLKRTNDDHGHSVGDFQINETVRIVRKNLEKDDFICRWGGDEFLLLLQAPPSRAEAKIKRIQKEMDAYNQREKQPFRLSFSYGLVPFPPPASISLDALLTQVDGLMYENKITKRALNKRRRRDD